MKRLLLSLLALVLTVGVVYAGMNVRQNSDGTADWIDTRGNASPLGAVNVEARIADVSSASTSWVISPITNVVIEDVQLVMQGALSTADARITITVFNTVSPIYTPLRLSVATTASPAYLLPASFVIPKGAVTGSIYSISPVILRETTGVTILSGATIAVLNSATRIYIHKGTAIAIATDGASTLVAPALVIITLRPKG